VTLNRRLTVSNDRFRSVMEGLDALVYVSDMETHELLFSQNGDMRNVEVHGYPIFDNNGRISQIIEYFLDITDRKRAEAALLEKEECLRTIMATIQTGVLVSETNSGRIVDVNPFASRLIGADDKALRAFMKSADYASSQYISSNRGPEQGKPASPIT
jgi:hypothetical protein